MSASESLYSEDIISDDQIAARIEYLEFLDSDWEEMTEAQRDMWEDDREELHELRALDTGDIGGLVNENYWSTYAEMDAEESFDLNKSGAYKYFDYDAYADDLMTDYSQVTFHGDTYYYM